MVNHSRRDSDDELLVPPLQGNSDEDDYDDELLRLSSSDAIVTSDTEEYHVVTRKSVSLHYVIVSKWKCSNYIWNVVCRYSELTELNAMQLEHYSKDYNFFFLIICSRSIVSL